MPDHGILQAEQRVREMNRMTRQYAEQGNRYIQSMTAPPTRFEPMHSVQHLGRSAPAVSGQDSPPPPPPEHSHSSGSSDSTVSIGSRQGFNFLGIEIDKLILIALIYLLIKENADIKLILALGYLLL